MRPPPLPLALAALAYAAAARAQGAPRVDGPVLLAPPTREVPSAERRLTAPQLGPRDALGPPRWGYGALAGGLVAGFGAAVTWLATKPPPARERRSGAPLQPVVELRRVTVSVGGAARGAIEAALADVGGRADPTTPAGRLALVTAVRDAIVQARAMVAHGAFQSWQLPADRGEEAYAIAAKRMRSKRPRSITGYARPGDPSSLAAVTLVWSQAGGSSGRTAMHRTSASNWVATLGPFAVGGDVTYRVEARDTAGARTTSPSATVGVDPCPG